MKTIRFYILLVFTGLFGFAVGQDFHTSNTKVEYENGTVTLTAKFFTNDLEKTLGTGVKSKADFEAKAKTYADSRLNLIINGKKVPLSFIGSQTSEKSTRLYFKADNITNISEIEIKNSMLIEVFPDQLNLVTIDINGVRKSFTAKKGSEKGKVNL